MTSSALQDPFGLAGIVLEGQYRVDAVVGEGGFGVVYRGRHLSLEQPIAIKVLKGLDGGDPRINALVLEQFRAEARLLYTLSQSSLHIVRALDFGATTTPGGVWAPFMILEWLEGRSLADDIGERRRRGYRGRSLEEAFAILGPVADGLGAAHAQQVAHRDVKPANVFLLGGGGSTKGPLVKVLDFGIAKIMKDGEAAGTKGTFASFTWLYAAPEQLEPRLGPTGLATDVYGFALLLTELLSDRKPVDDRDLVTIMKAATDTSRRPTPRTRGVNVPDEIEAVCLRALAVDPKHRFANVSELWSALVAARDARSSVARQAAAFAPTLTGPMPVSKQPSPLLASNDASPRGSTSVPTPLPRYATALPMSMPLPPGAPAGPPPGTLPPGFAVPSPMVGPPPGTRPPGFYGMAPYGAGPPPGTLPPGHWPRRHPFVRADGTSPIAVVTVILFVLAVLFAGSCALVHGACGASGGQDDSPARSTSRM